MKKLTINGEEVHWHRGYAEHTTVLDVFSAIVETQCSSLVALKIMAPAGELAEGLQPAVLTSLTRLTCLEACTGPRLQHGIMLCSRVR